MSKFSINLIDYLSDDDRKKVTDYLPFLICEKCKEIMLNPIYCSICQKTFCEKCSCEHKEELTRPRHLYKLLEEKLLIKCKYNCQEETFPIINLLEHIEQCPYKSIYLNKNCMIMDDFCDNIIDTDVDKIIPFNVKMPNDLLLSKIINKVESEKSNEIFVIKCYICDESIYNKNDYIKHIILCGSNNIKITQKLSVEEIEKKFEDLCLQMSNSYRDKFKLLLNQNLYEIKENILKIHFFIYPLKEKEKILNTLKESLIDEDYFKNELDQDPIYKYLQEKKKELFEQKEQLLKKYEEKNREKKNKIIQNQNGLIENNKTLIKQYLESSTEYKWLESVIKNFSPGIEGGYCSVCRSKENDKFYCPICKKRYCIEKCAFYCENEDCEKIICPECSESCKLCGLNKYCSSCLFNCFNELCKNKFCPICYEINKNQVRQNSSDNCMVFKCKHHNIIEICCILQTIYCKVCRKRMCYKCLEKDDGHKKINGICEE